MTDQLNLVDTIAKDEKFSTFTRLMKSSNANDVLEGTGPFTVFVPTNDAFQKIGERQLNQLLNEEDHSGLKALLSNHIFSGKWMTANVLGLGSPKSVSGQEVKFTDSNGLKINESKIQARNIEATNGVFHAIDTVLTLPIAAAAPGPAAS